MLPLLLISLVTIFALQYFNPPKSPPSSPEVVKNTPPSPKKNNNTASSQSSSLRDFTFPKSISIQNKIIETDRYLVKLSSLGARIQKLYLKSHDNLQIPKEAIENNIDPFGKKHQALEITYNNGMDFQPHLYYFGEYAKQLGSPTLNQATFSQKNYDSTKDLNTQQIQYQSKIYFRRKPLLIHKIYRFYKNENYFRQITILQNIGSQEFNLDFQLDQKTYQGALYYKTFSDIGPYEKEKYVSPVGLSARFFYYNSEFIQRNNIYSSSGASGGCSGSCSADKAGKYTSYTEQPNSLEFMGSQSKYFLAYNEFLAPQGSQLNRPDGIAYKNLSDEDNKESMTAIFANFSLASREKKKIEWKKFNLNTPIQANLQTQQYLRALQNTRKDTLVIDNMVFIGVRTTEAHSFKNPKLMEKSFGMGEANAKASESIHYNSYLALFSGVSNTIIKIMRWLHQYIGNYGWCIIFIALGFKLITFPLSQMQVKSMQRMSVLRPDLDEINKKYKDNPQEKQKRIMQLFKKHNVNPAKGCLPVIIQMPIFVGLYSAFSNSIELWYSPFIFWIEDLSKPDTVMQILGINLNILPLLMIASQILYQRFTSITMDSQQKMLTYIMPLVMLVFFWQIPSGVTLYWTMQNLISILWQQGANYFSSTKESI